MILQQIRETVRILKKYYPGQNALEILKATKVVTNYLDKSHLESTAIDMLPQGCCFKSNNIKFVLINPSLPEHEKNRVYTHELAHSIFHPEINTLRIEDYDKVLIDKLELQANMFCAEFILDDNIFEEYENCTKYTIAKCMGVTPELVDIKFQNLQKLNSINQKTFSSV